MRIKTSHQFFELFPQFQQVDGRKLVFAQNIRAWCARHSGHAFLGLVVHFPQSWREGQMRCTVEFNGWGDLGDKDTQREAFLAFLNGFDEKTQGDVVIPGSDCVIDADLLHGLIGKFELTVYVNEPGAVQKARRQRYVLNNELSADAGCERVARKI